MKDLHKQWKAVFYDQDDKEVDLQTICNNIPKDSPNDDTDCEESNEESVEESFDEESKSDRSNDSDRTDYTEASIREVSSEDETMIEVGQTKLPLGFLILNAENQDDHASSIAELSTTEIVIYNFLRRCGLTDNILQTILESTNERREKIAEKRKDDRMKAYTNPISAKGMGRKRKNTQLNFVLKKYSAFLDKEFTLQELLDYVALSLYSGTNKIKSISHLFQKTNKNVLNNLMSAGYFALARMSRSRFNYLSRCLDS
eukprot:CAMPEP_0206169746 /NCGR_PEP_ID=MMETSP1474-20131121/36692_1 /ASSEMBLY_ACC=CAM_ASM_001110 /TAXON_ID=97495 /ORGANISM="Imantonia sp., Strain RCC918" /LENGTH=257 /DNA_ID=CAMNT_0053575985 /DNA_START=406 /DNA_END=1179 /DNA_ORIENTATION=-